MNPPEVRLDPAPVHLSLAVPREFAVIDCVHPGVNPSPDPLLASRANRKGCGTPSFPQTRFPSTQGQQGCQDRLGLALK